MNIWLIVGSCLPPFSALHARYLFPYVLDGHGCCFQARLFLSTTHPILFLSHKKCNYYYNSSLNLTQYSSSMISTYMLVILQ